MTQLINPRLESLNSLQKMQREYSADANDFKIAKDTSVNGSNAELKAVADQFEAIFLEMLLKQARDSKLSDGLFDNKADDNFVQLFDQELAKTSSESVDIGIAEAIINQMAVHRLEK
jgi:flagellar protein FlgJ